MKEKTLPEVIEGLEIRRSKLASAIGYAIQVGHTVEELVLRREREMIFDIIGDLKSVPPPTTPTGESR